MKTLVLYLFGFSEQNRAALLRVLKLMSLKHDFEYEISDDPKSADMGFFENRIPKSFPKDLTLPQIILSDGSTYHGCEENQHRITWGMLETQIGLYINIIRHLSERIA